MMGYGERLQVQLPAHRVVRGFPKDVNLPESTGPTNTNISGWLVKFDDGGRFL